MPRRLLARAALIVVGLWAFLEALGALVGIPSRFADVGLLPRWSIYRVTDIWLFGTLALALVGLVGLAGVRSFGLRAASIALVGNALYLLLWLPVIDADLDLRRAYPRLASFALVDVAALLFLHAAWRWLCGVGVVPASSRPTSLR